MHIELGLLANQCDVKDPVQRTPQDLDNESYGLTRSPTEQEFEEYTADLLIKLKATDECNHAVIVKQCYEVLILKLTKGCV